MLTVKTLCEKTGLTPANRTEVPDREIESVYCCDLLSVAMGRTPADSAWVTVMGNLNVIAVSVLTDAACVILAEGAEIETRALEKAEQEEIWVLRSPQPVFETAKMVDALL
jgi:hypothetical protein